MALFLELEIKDGFFKWPIIYSHGVGKGGGAEVRNLFLAAAAESFRSYGPAGFAAGREDQVQ